jgi:hypothetical protein
VFNIMIPKLDSNHQSCWYKDTDQIGSEVGTSFSLILTEGKMWTLPSGNACYEYLEMVKKEKKNSQSHFVVG